MISIKKVEQPDEKTAITLSIMHFWIIVSDTRLEVTPNEVHTAWIPALCNRIHSNPPDCRCTPRYGLGLSKTVSTLTAIDLLKNDYFDVKIDNIN